MPEANDGEHTVGGNSTSRRPPTPGPLGPDPGPVSFWRRRGVLFGSSVAVIIAIAVVTDLPQAASPASKRTDATATVKEISADVAGCAAAIGEAFTIYRDEVGHSLTISDRKEAPSILADDANGCSYTNQSIVDLASINISRSGAGKALNQAASHALSWTDPDALSAVDDIAYLLDHPTSPKALKDLHLQEHNLVADRAAAVAATAVAGRFVGTPMPSIGLPRVSP